MRSNTNNDHKTWFMTIIWFSSSSSSSSTCSPGRLHKQKRRLVLRSDSLGNPHVRQRATARGRCRGKGEMFDRNLKAQGAEVQNQDIKALKSSHWKALWFKTSNKTKFPQAEDKLKLRSQSVIQRSRRINFEWLSNIKVTNETLHVVESLSSL